MECRHDTPERELPLTAMPTLIGYVIAENGSEAQHFSVKALNRGRFLDTHRRPQHFGQSDSVFDFKSMETLRANMATSLGWGC